MSTAVIHIKLNLEEGLKAAQIDLKQARSNVAMRTKLIQWLEGWISKGAPGTVSQRLDAARAMFAAKEGNNNNALGLLMIDRLNKLKESFETLFSAMPESSRSVLAVIPHSNLGLIWNALEGSAGEVDYGNVKEMNMLMHSLIEEATKHTKASDDNKDREFTHKLRELVSENAGSFTRKFLVDFNTTVKERQEEASIDGALFDPRKRFDPGNHLDQAMNLLLLEKDGSPVIDLGTRNINKDYETWSALNPAEKAAAQEEAKIFFANIENRYLEGMSIKDKQKIIQEQFNSIRSDNAKLLVRIKVQEEKTRASLIKHETDFAKIFGNLFGEGFGSQALATIVLGFAGGSLLGTPALGVFFTAVISFLGSMDPASTATRIPPQQNANPPNKLASQGA